MAEEEGVPEAIAEEAIAEEARAGEAIAEEARAGEAMEAPTRVGVVKATREVNIRIRALGIITSDVEESHLERLQENPVLQSTTRNHIPTTVGFSATATDV